MKDSYTIWSRVDEVTGLSVHIRQDEDPEDPRKCWDHLCRMVCWHRRYTLGDRHSWHDPEDFRGDVKGEQIIQMPIYLYDHSGLAVSTTPFHCAWDSGQIGWIYAERDAVLKEFGAKRLTAAIRKEVHARMVAEVSEYNAYLSGDVWVVDIEDEDGDIIDSCGGFIGEDHAMTEAKVMFEAEVSHARQRDAAFFAQAMEQARPDMYLAA